MCDNLPGDILKDITQERLERAIKQLEEEATE
jgi:hypothetical protein